LSFLPKKEKPDFFVSEKWNLGFDSTHDVSIEGSRFVLLPLAPADSSVAS